MNSITSESLATTWLAALQHLSDSEGWDEYNLILEVGQPMRRGALEREIESRVDAFLRAAGKSTISTVAETIFPASEYRRHGPKGVYETYPDVIYPAIKPLPELRWGTYAYRLVRRRGPSGDINPLECCVEKIKRQLAGRSTKVSCYELSLSDIYLDLPLYDPVTDRNHYIGGPCLSHISLKITHRRKLVLTALYRSHYYIQKALGNLIGLARLQAFVCEQTGLDPGPLVCVSTYAKLECEGGLWGKSDVLQLLSDLQAAVETAATETT